MAQFAPQIAAFLAHYGYFAIFGLLTLGIVGKTLFDAEHTDDESDAVGRNLSTVMRYLTGILRSPIRPPFSYIPWWRRDVVKALALGAKAVMIGRAYLWGLAAGGEAGVTNVLQILRSGIDEGLLGLGRASIHDLVPDDLIIPPDFTRASKQ